MGMRMEQVEPIRDPRKLAAIKKMLKGQDHPRDYLLFVMGVNTALRIGDLLSLKVGDVLDPRGEVVDYIHLREKKTGKGRPVKVYKLGVPLHQIVELLEKDKMASNEETMNDIQRLRELA